MRKIKRKRIPHDDKTIPQVAKILNIGNLVETEVDEFFMVVRYAISPFHHHVRLLVTIGPTRYVQIRRLAVLYMRADPIPLHIVLEMRKRIWKDMIEHSSLERQTFFPLHTLHQLADRGWNAILHSTNQLIVQTARCDLLLYRLVRNRPLVVEEGGDDHRRHVITFRLRQAQQCRITVFCWL